MLAAIVLAAFNRVMNTTYEFPLFIAIFADVGVSLIAILNSLLLLRSKKSKEMFNKINLYLYFVVIINIYYYIHLYK